MVWVTKMDDVTVQFDSARYEEIKKAVTAYLKDVGYKQKDIGSGWWRKRRIMVIIHHGPSIPRLHWAA